MGVVARDKNQLTLIYSFNTRLGKHVLSYLQGMEDSLLAIDISKTKISDTQWTELAEALHCKVGDLVDKRMVEANDTSEYGTTDWLKILQHNDEALQQPIAIHGSKTLQISNATDILRFFNVDSAGLEKTPIAENPSIKNTTQGESFIE